MLPTTVVGSYVQPGWLVDQANLRGRLPPRVRAREVWKIAPEHLEDAQDAATLVAIRDMERAGVDIISDGEIRRESYSNRFANRALRDLDIANQPRHGDRPHGPSEPRAADQRERSRGRPASRRTTRRSSSRTRRGRKRSPCPARSRCSSRRRTTSIRAPKRPRWTTREAVNAGEIKDLFRREGDRPSCSLDEPYLQARLAKRRESMP